MALAFNCLLGFHLHLLSFYCIPCRVFLRRICVSIVVAVSLVTPLCKHDFRLLLLTVVFWIQAWLCSFPRFAWLPCWVLAIRLFSTRSSSALLVCFKSALMLALSVIGSAAGFISIFSSCTWRYASKTLMYSIDPFPMHSVSLGYLERKSPKRFGVHRFVVP